MIALGLQRVKTNPTFIQGGHDGAKDRDCWT
jgi:hypothetical protein